MEDSLDQFYHHEYQALRQLGQMFATAHPDRARLLNADNVAAPDPYVEQLLRGTAFLAGRIREQIDEWQTDWYEDFINTWWPYFLQAIPSLTIVQFAAHSGVNAAPLLISRNTTINSEPVGPEQARCIFSTSSPVRILPVQLESVVRGATQLDFNFQLNAHIFPAQPDEAALRIFLHAEEPTAMMLHEYLTRRVVKIVLEYEAQGAFHSVTLPAGSLRPAPLDAAHALLPQDCTKFKYFTLMRDYFMFPERFLFIDLNGLEQLAGQECDACRVRIWFDKPIPDSKVFDTSTFRLFCTPAANVFVRDCEPVACSGKKLEYPLVADLNYRDSIHLHALRGAQGINNQTNARIAIEPLTAFRHVDDPAIRACSIHWRATHNGTPSPKITILGRQLDGRDLLQMTVSVEAWCSNGNLPREFLGAGSLRHLQGDIAESVGAVNIIRPTPWIAPPTRDRYDDYARLLISFGLTSLGRLDAFRAMLTIHEPTRLEGRQRRIESIKQIELASVNTRLDGKLVFGIEARINIEENAFADLNDLHLFGHVLREMLAMRAPINQYVNLCITCKPSNTQQWFYDRSVQ